MALNVYPLRQTPWRAPVRSPPVRSNIKSAVTAGVTVALVASGISTKSPAIGAALMVRLRFIGDFMRGREKWRPTWWR
jgi:hypothetical protein